jgi:DNA-binding NarL/FixJ family response regulator
MHASPPSVTSRRSVARALSEPAHIGIVQPDRFVADAMCAIVRTVAPTTRITVCQSAAEALLAMRILPADLVLCGLMLPDMDGLDLVTAMMADRLTRRVLIVSTRNDERTRTFVRAKWIGGYFDREVEPVAKLAEAIRAVLNGTGYFSPLRTPDARATRAPLLTQTLSPVETQVLAVIAEGADDDCAGVRLGMSGQTVHTHRRNIMRKLHVHTGRDLMREALCRGIIRFTANRVLHPGLERELADRADASHPQRKPALDPNNAPAQHGAGSASLARHA